MNKRDLLLIGAVAGAAASGVGWLVNHQLTAPRGVTPVDIGDPLPALRGKLLTGKSLSLPGDLRGHLGLLILTWDYAALDEVTQWAREAQERYGVLDDLNIYQVALVNGVGPVLRRVFDRVITQRAPSPEGEHILVVFGDLRALRRQLDTAATAEPHAMVLLADRQGRLAWRMDGPPTLMNLVALRKALADHGIEMSGE